MSIIDFRMVNFYVVRHGNTEFNNKKTLQGGQIDSPLTDEGFKDAIFLSRKLKGIKFDAIFSSDLGRAFITAHIIADSFGLTSIYRYKDLREIDFGDLTAMPRDEAKLKYPDFKKDAKFRCPNGESYLDVKKRILKGLFSLSRKNYKNVLIVTHAGCIRGIMSAALGKDLNLLLEKAISHEFISKLEIKNKKIINFHIINE